MFESSCWLLIWVTYVFTSVYALLDPGSKLSFMTTFLDLTFEILPEVLHDPVLVSTPLG